MDKRLPDARGGVDFPGAFRESLGEQPDKLVEAPGGTVENPETAATGRQRRAGNRARRATRAEKHNVRVAQWDPKLLQQGAREALSIGVVSSPARWGGDKGVDGSGALARRRDVDGKLQRQHLVREREVQATETPFMEKAQCLRKLPRLDVKFVVMP